MQGEQRFHALDAVRAFALLSGIVLHATMSYLPDIGATAWPIQDRSQSLTLEVTFWVIHVFRMTAFFLIAGFFARLLLHRRGTAGFIRDRAKRILGPLIAAWLVTLPLIGIAVLWAMYKLNGNQLPAPPANGSATPNGVPWAHLWFLYYLLLFYAVALPVRAVFVKWLDGDGTRRAAIDRAVSALVNSYFAPLVLALPIAVCLYLLPRWLWIGIPTPETGFTPYVPATVAYGTAFVFGWLLHRQAGLLSVLERRWLPHLVVAIVATAGAWLIVGAPLSFQTEVPQSARLPYAATYALASWTWVFAIVGIGMRFCSGASSVRRYIADSSYWMYLVHMPLLMLLQAWMMQWNLHWTIKFPLLLAMSFALLLASYHFLVRSTAIGNVLNGRRYPRRRELPEGSLTT